MDGWVGGEKRDKYCIEAKVKIENKDEEGGLDRPVQIQKRCKAS